MVQRLIAACVCLALVPIIYAGCAGKDCGTAGTCGNADVDGSVEGGGGDDGGPGITDGMVSVMEGGNPMDAPLGCDVSKDPSDAPLCVDEGMGVFVDSNSAAATPDGAPAR